MVLIAHRLSQMNLQALMGVYRQSNTENGREFYPDASLEQQLFRVEERFLSYLREDFFRQKGAFYAVLVEDGQYVSALRLEPHEDGWLLEALETHPDHRKKGYAAKLMCQTLEKMQSGAKVYSHVSKRNKPSLATHLACGFTVEKDYAVSLDGTVTSRQFTLQKTV